MRGTVGGTVLCPFTLLMWVAPGSHPFTLTHDWGSTQGEGRVWDVGPALGLARIRI